MYFYQSWCSNIPDIILEKTILNMPDNAVYKCYSLSEIKDYLLNKWGITYLNLFNSYKSTAHKIDLWRYCILYDTGGFYMDADCVLNSKINFITKSNMCFVTNSSGVKNIFNGFIYVEQGNPIMKEMIDYMITTGVNTTGVNNEDNYYYNCEELYRVINKYIDINHSINEYESLIGRIYLLIDKFCNGRYNAFYENTNILVETNSLYPYK